MQRGDVHALMAMQMEDEMKNEKCEQENKLTDMRNLV